MATHIRVVLTDDLHNVGKSGELVKVRPGFARNYLIPRGLAVGATAGNVARIEHEKKVAELRATKTRAEAEDLAKKLSAVKVTISRPVGEGDRPLRIGDLARRRGGARGAGLHRRPPPHRDRAD